MLELAGAAFCLSPRWFQRAAGVQLAALGDQWAVHTPLAGASHLLNEESAAILLSLSPHAPVSSVAVCSQLAHTWQEPVSAIDALVAPVWNQLISAGLVTEHSRPSGD